MNKRDFFYHLPPELIAQTPQYPRDHSRMLVYDRHNKTIEDRLFYNIIDYLRQGDLLVINNTKVIPARIFGKKQDTGASIECLLHKRLSFTDWEIVCKPAKRLHAGSRVIFSDCLTGEVLEKREEGSCLIRFTFSGIFENILNEIGQMPLPHYIKSPLLDNDRYQTVYAKTDGSCAAPTAGLHFTPSLMEEVRAKGVEFAEVLLHVGLGTFRPVKTEDITKHNMHSEYYAIDEANAQRINLARKENRRIIAVGTTSVRVLESAADAQGMVKAGSGNTNIFIYPPYSFKTIGGLITNFHLPESTLIMLVSAFCGREETMRMYRHAVDNQYKFFSFGDATFII